VGILRAIFRVVTRIEEISLAWGILGIAALTIANVIGRTVFDRSVFFAEEVSQFLIVFVTFMGLGYGASRARHIRMTAIYDQLSFRGRKILMSVITGTTAALMFVLTWLSIDYVLGTVAALGAVSPALRVPVYLVYLSAPLGLFLAAIQYALAFTRNLMRPEIWVSFDTEEGEAAAEEIEQAGI
jgi:TRAP-type C4-dicarboxylate transport system permease small subunit